MKSWVVAMCLVSLSTAVVACHHTPPAASADAPGAEAEQRIVDESAAAVTSMRQNARFESLDRFLKDARGVLVFPRLIKASFIVGGEGGTGVLVARGKDGTFSAPAFYGIGSGSIGPQIGYREAAVVLLLMNDGALDAVLRSGLTLGANASVAAGNDTGEARATTATHDVIAYVDVDGVFAGASIDGAVVEPRSRWSSAYYGKDVVPSEIVVERKYDHPGAAALRAALAVAAPAPAASAVPTASAAPPIESAPSSDAATGLAPTPGEQQTCTAEQRKAEMCTMLYAPVCAEVDTGVRCIKAPCPSSKFVQFSNACAACRDKKTLSYYAGPCAPVAR
ncbi:MAG TPA: lipid-binding SYLF domain-containing protein [Polyangiaceae bacterium]|jgi:lipid-binding SYLF domain-containing protein|nr:lipid-binding SYLF domain-containing protein [Polyangiaceae bacterium]